MPNRSSDRAMTGHSLTLTRRQILRGIAGSAVLASGLLVACGAPAAAPTSAPAAPPPTATLAPAAPAPTSPRAAPAATTTPQAAAPTAAAAPAGSPKSGGKAIWAMTTDPTCLAPYGVLPGPAHEGKEMLYDSLVQWDRNLNVVPALADSWSVPDNKTYIFKLKQGVKFHNGKELDAEDVKYSVELQGNPPKPGAPIPQYPQIASVDVVDKYTVKLSMKGPDPTVLGWFAWTRWSAITTKGFYDSGNPCVTASGTGPFKLVEYVANDHVAMAKHPDFWKKSLPYLDELTLKIMPDESARIAALRSGAIDGTDVSSDAARTLKNDPNVTIIKGLTSTPRVLQFTIKGDGKPWDDKRVRQAMSLAIDRSDLVEKVYGGDAELTGPIPPGYGDFSLSTDTLKKYFTYDLDGAKKLLADAGVKAGFSITINTVPAPADYPQSAQVVSEHLKKLGIDVKIVTEDIAIFAKRYNEGTFEWLLNGRGMRQDPTGYVNEFGRPDLGQAKGWFNGGNGWKNDELTQLYKDTSVNLDQKARVPQIQRIQELALEEAPHVFLAQPYKFTAVRKSVQDMYVSFTDFRPGLREIWLH